MLCMVGSPVEMSILVESKLRIAFNVVLPVASVVGFKPLVRWELGVECCTRQAFLLFPWAEVAHAVCADHTYIT